MSGERLRLGFIALNDAAALIVADAPRHRAELVAMLAHPNRVAADPAVIEASLVDIVYDADGANAPQPIHAAWMLSQMMRWGHVAPEVDIARIAARVYRPDLHAEAVSDLGRPATQPLETLEGFSPWARSG